ncbi:cytochrome P450 [Lentzea sp. NPDC042327]|uniref:cytochrome P450 n=1 Tax=Lentzea sp. NPDC042327 TaxID=3154801 RepID=UPI0033C6120E
MTRSHADDPGALDASSTRPSIGEFDHLDPRLADTLHGTFAGFRGRCPVAHSTAHGGFVLVTGQDDIAAVAKDGATYSAAVTGLGAAALFPGSGDVIAPLFETDPPTHTGWRRLLQPFFTPAAVEAHAPFIQSTTDEVLAELVPRGRCEAGAEIAARIPTVVVAEVMGVAKERHQELAALGRGLVAPDSPQQARDAVAGVVEFLRREIRERRDRVNHDADPLTAVVHAVVEGRAPSDDELLKHAFIMVSAGFMTTVDTLSNAVLQLARDPGLRTQVRRDHSLVADFIEEVVRHEPPIVATARTVLRAATLGGVDLQPGDRLLLAWASGCRDERHVDDPARFRLDRPRPGRSLGWGAGVHRCLGMRLARLQLRIVLSSLLDAIPDFTLDPGMPPTRTSGVLRGVRHLHLTWRV